MAIDRSFYEMGYGKWTAPAIGDRFGAAALVEVLRHLDTAKTKRIFHPDARFVRTIAVRFNRRCARESRGPQKAADGGGAGARRGDGGLAPVRGGQAGRGELTGAATVPSPERASAVAANP